MKKLIFLLTIFLLVSCLAFTVSAKTAAETVMIFMEAEDCILEGYTVTDKAGAVGKAITSTEVDTQKFTLNFDIPKDGKYVIWVKVLHASQTDNSIKYIYNDVEHAFDFCEYLGVPDDPAFFMYNQWYWMFINERGTEILSVDFTDWGDIPIRHQPVILDLKAGSNTFTFISREAGHFIDQLIITDDLEYDPGDVPGNEKFLCDYCLEEHFKKDTVAITGKTPQEHWNEKLAAEASAQAPEIKEPEAPAADAAAAVSPMTFDPSTALALSAFLSVSLLIVLFKKRHVS